MLGLGFEIQTLNVTLWKSEKKQIAKSLHRIEYEIYQNEEAYFFSLSRRVFDNLFRIQTRFLFS